MTGRIIKALADFYYIYCDGNTYQCKAKGIFRKKNQAPLVGDVVDFELTHAQDIEGNIIKIHSRKSELKRPAVSNIDGVLLVFAIKDPLPNFYHLDRFLAIAKNHDLKVIIVFNKIDIDDEKKGSAYAKVYRDIGYDCITASTYNKEGIALIKSRIRGMAITVAGPSGAGKSSLINALAQRNAQETGDISAKNKRGKQTTRHTSLLPIDTDTFIVDTPGFSQTDISEIAIENLDFCFPEMEGFRQKCRFSSCRHLMEPDCEVKAAVERGDISTVRYENYCKMAEELKKLKPY